MLSFASSLGEDQLHRFTDITDGTFLLYFLVFPILVTRLICHFSLAEALVGGCGGNIE
jgi:hypothetical protein